MLCSFGVPSALPLLATTECCCCLIILQLKDVPLYPEPRLLACLQAAITHDYEHKGLNNDFLVRVGDDLALTYNDNSPMENHHIASSFKLLRHKDYNFLKRMPRDKLVGGSWPASKRRFQEA